MNQPTPVDEADDGSSALHIAGLHLYPVKSCAGVSLGEVQLSTTGFTGDRQWMVVDGDGRFVTQRELPRMALVTLLLAHETALLRAPGMPELPLPRLPSGQTLAVQVWNDRVPAEAVGPYADVWLSAFLGRRLRLVRFDPQVRRLSNRRWSGDVEALNAFSDGFPILVISAASLLALNERLHGRGQPPVEMARFRPNLVIDGLDAHAEDSLDELRFDTPAGPVVLRLVKPCPRCPIPNIDPATGEAGTEPGDTLATYRADPRLDGAITFGMNAVIVEGIGRTLRTGQAGRGTVRF
ncbi:MAG: MOSC N-terminal beta barrel domain-containing protein [Burkholderiales bacterium]